MMKCFDLRMKEVARTFIRYCVVTFNKIKSAIDFDGLQNCMPSKNLLESLVNFTLFLYLQIKKQITQRVVFDPESAKKPSIFMV